jgi:peptidoglycan hydrolase-like protein with peptidoglycan-binding domain
LSVSLALRGGSSVPPPLPTSPIPPFPPILPIPPIPGTPPIGAIPVPLPVPAGCTIIYNTLYHGLRDSQVNGEISKLQDFLFRFNYMSVRSVTGYFGIVTLNAVKKFQAQNGISTTGYVGPITRERIRANSCDRG